MIIASVVFFQVLNLLGFICITVSSHSSHSRGGWFNTVAMGGFWFTGILLVLYLFHIIEKFSKIPWLKIVSRLDNDVYLSHTIMRLRVEEERKRRA